MYIFNEEIQKHINSVVSQNTVVTPNQPPYITVTKGKHTSKQKLGKFLNRLAASVVKQTVEQYKEINGDLSQYVLSHSTDYVGVYEHPLYAIDSTTKSCMTGDNSVRVYDYDARLSLFLVHKDNKLVGRTLVRSDKMEFVRLYIDHNYIKAPIMRAIVAKEGYLQGDLEGIKLDYIEENDTIVCPYLDHVSRFDVIDEDHILISYNGDYDGSSTNGYVELEGVCTCESCGTRVSVDDTYYVENEGCICNSCFTASYIFYNCEVHAISDCITNESDGELIPESCVDYVDVMYTEDGTWYNSDEVVCVEGCYYHIDACKQLVVKNDNDDSYCLSADAIEVNYVSTLKDGYYTTQQVEEELVSLQETFNSLQADLFEDFESVELTEEELATLVNDISILENLL